VENCGGLPWHRQAGLQMKKKYSIEFKLSHSPISKPITKFGGQPVWINQAQWPISKMQYSSFLSFFP
jgi:hypothetical protein